MHGGLRIGGKFIDQFSVRASIRKRANSQVWSSAAIPAHHRPDSTSIVALIASYRAFSAVLSVFGSNWGYLVLGRKKTLQRSEGEHWRVRSMIDQWVIRCRSAKDRDGSSESLHALAQCFDPSTKLHRAIRWCR